MGVVEVYDIESRCFFVIPQMVTQVIVGDQCEIVEFKIIDIQTETLLYVLLNVAIDNSIAFPGAGSSKHHSRPEWVHYVYPSVTPKTFVVILCRKIYRVFIIQELRFLFEAFILIVERIIDIISFKPSAEPYPGCQQTEITNRQREDIEYCTASGTPRQMAQGVVEEKEQQTTTAGNGDLPTGYLF